MRVLIVNGHRSIRGHFLSHGQELPPELLGEDEIAEWLDRKWLEALDSSVRRSFYELFSEFSGTEMVVTDDHYSDPELAGFQLPE